MQQSPARVSCIEAEWPAPSWVRAVTTTRRGGTGAPPFAGLNLADHVGDRPEVVASNRSLLKECLRLPNEPHWLDQRHGTTIVRSPFTPTNSKADGACTEQAGIVCAVLTADCVPVLLCDHEGTCVAAVHAGWRGLLSGVVQSALLTLQRPGDQILAWLGPAIGPQSYEVGADVRKAFLTTINTASEVFVPHRPGYWLTDLYGLVRHHLWQHGISKIYGGSYCTFSDPENFFSHQRDGTTGRMASLIWLDGRP